MQFRRRVHALSFCLRWEENTTNGLTDASAQTIAMVEIRCQKREIHRQVLWGQSVQQ
jgi:hypothetical protein